MLLFPAFVLLCLELGLGATEHRNCYSCLMNYPGTGCTPGDGACRAYLQRGQACITIHVFHQEQELYRVNGCTKPGFYNCGIEKKIGNYTVKFECCTEKEMCKRVFFNPDEDDDNNLEVFWT